MCSRNEDDGDMPPSESINLTGSFCRKCNDSPAKVILQRKFPYCRECFISAVTRKYRSTLGKSKLMKHGDRVLLAYSGSGPSTCLVHMVKTALDDPKKKKIKTDFVIFFVDDMLPNVIRPFERAEILKEVRDSLETYEFEKYQTSLDFAFEEQCQVWPLATDSPNDSPEPNIRIQNLLSDCKSSSSALDLLRRLRYRLLFSASKTLNCNKIFLAETSDHLAINIISNVALGRGEQLQIDVGFRDNRYEGVDFLRPLQECSKKEIAFYNSFIGLRPVIIPPMTTKMGTSIQKITQDFITNLAVSFPATVHTVVATGGKMVVREDQGRCICSLCKGVVHADEGPLSSLKATAVSSQVSLLGPAGFDSDSLRPNLPCSSDSCSTQNGACCRTDREIPDVLVPLCHGCQLIVKDFTNMDNWPLSIRRSIEEDSQFVAMHQQIKDFLL